MELKYCWCNKSRVENANEEVDNRDTGRGGTGQAGECVQRPKVSCKVFKKVSKTGHCPALTGTRTFINLLFPQTCRLLISGKNRCR